MLYSGANPENSERAKGTLASYIGIIYFTDNSQKKRCSGPLRTNPKSTSSNRVAFHSYRLRVSLQGTEGFFDRLKIGAFTRNCSVHTKQQEQRQQLIVPKARCQNYFTTYCWFSHCVTKIQTKKLSILPRFYFHDVLEKLKTSFHTNFRLKRVLGFVIEYA